MDLKARSYNASIELWKVNKVSDGFGGLTTENQYLTTIFARRENLNTDPLFAEGQKIDQQLYRFHIRAYNITSDMFIVYKSRKYDIRGVRVSQLQSQMSLDCISTFEIFNETFDLTFDNTFA